MSTERMAFSPESLYRELPALGAGQRLWIAYSGGLDSGVLLDAAAVLRPRLACELRAVHVDHGLHPDSRRWATHCRSVCEGLDVPLQVVAVGVESRRGESLEALARAARYEAISGLLRAGDTVATAQHRDDQAETVLLALLRGAGVHGLAGMARRAPLGEGVLIRPLLAHGRAALEAYARRRSLGWIDDPSNADTRFDRNLLRLEVLPLLRRRWPGLDKTLARSASHCGEAARLLDAEADALLAEASGSRPGTLSVPVLQRLPAASRRLLLRRWVAVRGFRAPGSGRLARIATDCLEAAPDRGPVVAWGDCEVRRYRQDLYLLASLPPAPGTRVAIPWDGVGPLPLPGCLGRLVAGQGFDPPRDELVVRFGAPGLRCRRGAGASRPLKHLYQEAGVPAWLRPYIPLVLRREQLCAVAGVAVCDPSCESLRWIDHPWTGLGLPID